MYAIVLLLVLAFAGTAPAENRDVTLTPKGLEYQGIGALSGGGGTSRLLWDYDRAVASEILDVLFKPNSGASLQIFKVEIGGDAQSTEATEASHMHTREDLNYERGYEWWLMKEAKARNPNIKLYGLSWGAPGWIGNHTYYSEDCIFYHITWLDGARAVHGLEIDYLGIWNEKKWNSTWIKQLRKALDEAGFPNTKIVAADDYGKLAWAIIPEMEKDKELYDAVAVVGAHYPYHGKLFHKGKFGRPLWASECWDLQVVGDWNGGWELARMLNRNYLEGNMTAAIIWNLIFSWYPILPFSNHDNNTTTGHGHSLMYAGEPWSGNYTVQPPIYVMAHTSQFTDNNGDWVYAPYDSTRNKLKNGATFVVLSTKSLEDVTIVIESTQSKKTERVTFKLKNFKPAAPGGLAFWRTTEMEPFKHVGSIPIEGSYPDHTVTVTVAPGQLITLTSRANGGGPKMEMRRDSRPFPFPYYDDLKTYKKGAIVKYFADQGGSWQADPSPTNPSESAFHQVVLEPPIPWSSNPTPVTYIGDYRWTDVQLSASVYFDSSIKTSYPQFASFYLRIHQNTNFNHVGPARPYGYYAVAHLNGTVVIHKDQNTILYRTELKPLPTDTWIDFVFAVHGDTLQFQVGKHTNVQAADPNGTIPSGMAAIGCGWHSTYFQDFSAVVSSP